MAFGSCINIPVLIQLLEYICDEFMLLYIKKLGLPLNFFHDSDKRDSFELTCILRYIVNKDSMLC